MSTFTGNIPLVSKDAFNVPAASAITGGNGAHGTIVWAGTTGKWIKGDKFLARKILASVETTTVGSSVTEAKVYLGVADDADGANAAAVTGAAFAVASPAAATWYAGSFDVFGNISADKFYALGVSYKASAGTNHTGTAHTVAHFLDPYHSA